MLRCFCPSVPPPNPLVELCQVLFVHGPANWEGSSLSYKSLTTITLPATVAQIGGQAFLGCRSLASITLPASVTQIGGQSFLGCTSLASITLPASVTQIGVAAFQGCTSLASITIPESVTQIGGHAFYDCTSLSLITLPASVTEIGERAFYGCTSLASITIPESVTQIGPDAFKVCTSLSSITIPSANLGQTLLLPPRVYMGEMEVDIPTFHLAIKDGPIEASIRQHYELGIRCVPLLSALDAMTTSGPMAILGIPFLREYAVYFDRASWGMSVAQIEEGSSVCSQCGTTFASRLIEHISGSSETALAAGSSALQPEAITATMSSNNVRRAAPIKVSRVRGPSLHGVPTVIMPNMLDDAHRHEVPAWTHHNRTRRVWVL